jgi:hypothetical protein
MEYPEPDPGASGSPCHGRLHVVRLLTGNERRTGRKEGAALLLLDLVLLQLLIETGT